MRECEARGEWVADGCWAAEGDTPEDCDRVFDKMAEVSIKSIRQVLALWVPEEVRQEVIEDVVITTIRCIFQAQILHLRRQRRSYELLYISWAEPERMARDPKMMQEFEANMSLALGAERAAECLVQFRRRFPVKPNFSVVK